MSNTRIAKPGSRFRQERYASSAEFDRGLMANLVARRCSILEDPSERELVWYLQLLSHQEGGLERLARDLIANNPEAFVTSTMERLGAGPGQIYQAQQVRAVREDFPLGLADEFLLRGECCSAVALGCSREEERQEEALATRRPVSYPAAHFSGFCRKAAMERFSEYLRDLCLNPAADFNQPPWYCSGLSALLTSHLATVSKQAAAAMMATTLSRKVFEALDYAWGSRCLVVVDGLERMGKTVAAKTWCAMRPGRARYVQTPSTADDTGFYRALARSFGVSINQNSKAVELRSRIEDVLQQGDLILVLDEAHYLWPQREIRAGRCFPDRINWLMTAAINHGVPVALITTPQFAQTQRAIEEMTWWRSGQFVGRIGHYEKLPESLPVEDLENVTRFLLPEADASAVSGIVGYAQASAKYLAGIETVVRRSRYLASRESRDRVSRADIKRAISESVIPSDNALANTLAAVSKSRKRAGRAVAIPLQPEDIAEAPTSRDTIAPVGVTSRSVTPLVSV